METIISSLITGAVLIGLIGVIWKGLTQRVERIEERKVNKETCNIVHVEADKKFSTIFTKLDNQSEVLAEIAGDIKVIIKEVNNNG